MAEEYLTDDEQLEAVKRLVYGVRPVDRRRSRLVGAAVFFGYRYYQRYTNDRAPAGRGAVQRR